MMVVGKQLFSNRMQHLEKVGPFLPLPYPPFYILQMTADHGTVIIHIGI